MLQSLDDPELAGLERSCTLSRGDWVRVAATAPGLERIEAFFHGHAYDAHRHDTYALGLTLSGVQSFDYRGSRRDSTAGQAIILHPDEVHNGRSGIEAGFRYRMLYLEPRMVRQALGKRAKALPFVPAGVSADPRLVRAVSRALADLDGAPCGLEVDDIVLGLSEAMLAQDPSLCQDSHGGVSFDAAERARQFLDNNLDRSVQSPELEAVAGLDRFTLARHFRASFGTSPYNYLVMRRLDRARSLLATDRGLVDIACACGFADQSHMTRQFRRAYGMTPGRWRKLLA
jgi:AraC-like DNA-binding protein